MFPLILIIIVSHICSPIIGYYIAQNTKEEVHYGKKYLLIGYAGLISVIIGYYGYIHQYLFASGIAILFFAVLYFLEKKNVLVYVVIGTILFTGYSVVTYTFPLIHTLVWISNLILSTLLYEYTYNHKKL